MGDFEFVRTLRGLGMEAVNAEDFAEHLEALIDKRVATKADLAQANLQHTAEMARLETRMVERISNVEMSLSGSIASLENKLTWRMVGLFLATGPISWLVKHYL